MQHGDRIRLAEDAVEFQFLTDSDALEGTGGVLGSWTIVTITRPKKSTISGLTLAGIYQFQIRALGVLGYTDWMDTKTFVVA